jgi:hypothetical protein
MSLSADHQKAGQGQAQLNSAAQDSRGKKSYPGSCSPNAESKQRAQWQGRALGGESVGSVRRGSDGFGLRADLATLLPDETHESSGRFFPLIRAWPYACRIRFAD